MRMDNGRATLLFVPAFLGNAQVISGDLLCAQVVKGAHHTECKSCHRTEDGSTMAAELENRERALEMFPRRNIIFHYNVNMDYVNSDFGGKA
jgi:hypothetical protein